MKKIPLTRGTFALIDDEDYALISAYSWHAMSTGKQKDVFYAVAHTREGRKLRKSVLMHRLVLGAKKGEKVDHKNHDTLDNRKENIRIGTSALNQFNRQPHRNKKYSPYKGAYFDARSKKWYSHFLGKYIGTFNTDIEAAKAYDAHALRYNKEWACINNIET